MSKHDVTPLAICPFYKHTEKQRICCEGVEGSASTHVSFSVPDDRKQYEMTHCRCWSWEECPVAKMLWSGYEDESTAAASVGENLKLKRAKPRPGKKFSAYPPEELRLISQRGGVASGVSRRARRERINAEKITNTAILEQRRENIEMLRANAALLLEAQRYRLGSMG